MSLAGLSHVDSLVECIFNGIKTLCSQRWKYWQYFNDPNLHLSFGDLIVFFLVSHFSFFNINRSKSFRQSYLDVVNIRSYFPGVPLLAMTATASPQTMEQLQSLLSMQNPVRIIASPDRPNIFLDVKLHPSADDEAYSYLAQELLQRGVSCKRHIIYVQVSLSITLLPRNLLPLFIYPKIVCKLVLNIYIYNIILQTK